MELEAREPLSTIQCQYRMTLGEFLTANEQFRRHSRPLRRLVMIMWGIALCLLAAGTTRMINLGFNKTSVLLLIFGIAIIASRFFSRRVLVRMFDKLPDRDADVRWQIDAERLVVETPTSRTENTWSRVSNIVQTDRGFLIHYGAGTFHWLPLHSFSDAFDIERFERMIASRESA
jgi:hypothetical protein